MDERHRKYKQGPEYFNRFLKSLLGGTATAVLGIAAKVSVDNWRQLKYTMSTWSQWQNEFFAAIQRGDLSNPEALKLLPALVCCVVPMAIIGMVLARKRKRKS